MTVRLVHFFGPDGSGKSTQMNLLMDYCKIHGVKAKKFWLRSPHTMAYILWKVLVRIGFYRCIENEFGTQIKLPAVQSSAFLKTIWFAAEFVSVLPLILLSRLYLARGYLLVAERYILDTVTTIHFFVDENKFTNSFLSVALLKLIPRGTEFIFLDSSFEAIRERRARFYSFPRNGKRSFRNAEPPAPNLEPRIFIDYQRKMYGGFARSFGALVIDTSKTPMEETSRKIRKYIFG